ncbi:hypothetical protein B5X24_HaOG205807 [Helicoverpa armigera]|nr:hypothetical protein B5X24_HaOG205807 [Helicoverpa armigera]
MFCSIMPNIQVRDELGLTYNFLYGPWSAKNTHLLPSFVEPMDIGDFLPIDRFYDCKTVCYGKPKSTI